MTLCKYRPRRTYDGQFLLDENDVRGLLKKSREAAKAMRESGVASTPYYEGAAIAFDALFGIARDVGDVDMWSDWIATFEDFLEELEGDDLSASQS